MSTIKDFENASVGATATHDDGRRAMRMADGERHWITPTWVCHNDEEMARRGYLLDPFVPWIPTAREALDLVWDRAHEVKEGYAIPKGTRYLKKDALGLKEYIAQVDFEIWPGLVQFVRTLEPLPDLLQEPETDWLDAPAVLAHTDNNGTRGVWTVRSDDLWASTSHTYARHWRDLRDVTPLYPKETKETK